MIKNTNLKKIKRCDIKTYSTNNLFYTTNVNFKIKSGYR